MILYDRSINVKREKNLSSEEKLFLEESQPEDGYIGKLVKLIPAEVVAFFMALNAISASFTGLVLVIVQWLSLTITIIGGILYLYKYNNVRKTGQLILSVIPVFIWIYVIGGPFENFCWYNQAYGEYIGAIYTFFIPFAYK